MQIEQKYLPSIGKIFSPLVLDNIALKGYSPYLTEICINSGMLSWVDTNITIKEFLENIYVFLFNNYRNEYIYKNAIANNILLGNHSLDTTQMLTEFRIGNSKADVVLLNGNSTVYEIKSQYDSFTRVEKQIQSYLEVFDNINVITTYSQAIKLESILPQNVGILILENNTLIETFRTPTSNIENINLNTLFDSLRKSEYIKVIKEYYNYIPEVPNTLIYKECKRLYRKIPTLDAHDISIKALKTRNNSKRLKYFIENAPSSIYAYAMTISNDKNKMAGLLNQMERSLNSIISIHALN